MVSRFLTKHHIDCCANEENTEINFSLVIMIIMNVRPLNLSVKRKITRHINETGHLIRESRANYFESLDIRSQPKRFWSIFKLTNKSSNFPDVMSLGSVNADGRSEQPTTASTPKEIAQLFNHYFASVFSPSTIGIPSDDSMQVTGPVVSRFLTKHHIDCCANEENTELNFSLVIMIIMNVRPLNLSVKGKITRHINETGLSNPGFIRAHSVKKRLLYTVLKFN